MNKRLKLLIFTVTLLAFGTGIWAIADVKVLNLGKANFQDGQLLSAKTLNDLLNDNFGTLETALTGLETSKQNRVGNPCPGGQFVRGVGVDGKLECAVDQMGSGGSAGVSSLNGKAGSLAIEAGDNVTIDNSKDGKITVSVSGGGGGLSTVAHDASLNGNGTAASPLGLADGGVTTDRLADGAVTGAKIAMPLRLTADTPSVASVLANANPAGMGLLVDLGSQPNTFANTALMGRSTGGIGVIGESTSGIGVWGKSSTRAVVGTQGDTSCSGTYAVGGCATTANGVTGVSTTANGVGGRSTSGSGVSGASSSGNGVGGISSSGVGVSGTSSTGSAAVFRGGSGGTGACSYNGGAGWNCTSDRGAKENFRAVEPTLVLEQLAAMPVSTWSMKGDEAQTPHLGPTAQDFYAAFNLGDSDITINSADAQGVALAAIQGLYQLVQEQEKRIAELEAQLAESR
jgi:hypothetical protein